MPHIKGTPEKPSDCYVVPRDSAVGYILKLSADLKETACPVSVQRPLMALVSLAIGPEESFSWHGFMQFASHVRDALLAELGVEFVNSQEPSAVAVRDIIHAAAQMNQATIPQLYALEVAAPPQFKTPSKPPFGKPVKFALA